MVVLLTAFYAFHFRPTRREWRVSGDAEARRRLLTAAARLKYAPAAEDANYLRLRLKGFKLKPVCSNVEVWFTPEEVLIDGPHGVVNRLAKRLTRGA